MPAILTPRPVPRSKQVAPLASPLPISTRPRPKPYSRRRTSHRAPRASEPISIHPFDQLPWIAALDATPNNLWDIADLSQIPDTIHRPSRRAPPDLIHTSPPRPASPPCDTPAVSSRPTTPLSRFIPSRVLFHNLMPVLCDSPNGHDPCTSSPLQPSFFQLH